MGGLRPGPTGPRPKRCAENWAPIGDIPNFGSFLAKNWVGVGLGVENFQKLGSRLGLGLQN